MKYKYLVPPKLQEDMLILGFKIHEAGIALTIFVVSIVFRLYIGMPMLAFYIVYFIRFDGVHNAHYFMMLLYRYHHNTQHYTERLNKL